MHVETQRQDGKPTVAERLEPYVFDHRTLIVAAFAVLTVIFGVIAARGLHLDTNFNKQLPLGHEYVQTYLDHKAEFGGANRVLIGLVARDGNMFTPEFFEALKIATDEVFFIPGVDRARVQSLWTPNVRYTEVVEGGIEAGDVIPPDFQPDAAGLARVKENILKAGIVGRLVANDFSGAITVGVGYCPVIRSCSARKRELLIRALKRGLLCSAPRFPELTNCMNSGSASPAWTCGSLCRVVIVPMIWASPINCC